MPITSLWPGRTGPSTPAPAGPGWIFEDPSSKAVLADIEQVAPSDASVLISGKTGTGKELIARYLHGRSLRRDGPFVAVTCGAFSEMLVDAELFGHENGAFTGAFGIQAGRFEEADGGTLYLDEINDLPMPVQTKLLRVLRNREVLRLGGFKSIPVDVRILASATVDLEALVAAGKFREDLYYRLNVVNLEIAPLAERPGDIVPLARHFIQEYSRELNYSGGTLTPDAERALRAYGWPGNVRELENVIHRTLLMRDGGAISAADLRFPARTSAGRASVEPRARPEKPADSSLDLLRRAIRQLCDERTEDLYQLIERTVVNEAFEYCDYNQSETARLLSVHRNVVRVRLTRSGAYREPRRTAYDARDDTAEG